MPIEVPLPKSPPNPTASASNWLRHFNSRVPLTALTALQEYYQAQEALQEAPKDEELESEDDDIVFITSQDLISNDEYFNQWTIID